MVCTFWCSGKKKKSKEGNQELNNKRNEGKRQKEKNKT